MSLQTALPQLNVIVAVHLDKKIFYNTIVDVVCCGDDINRAIILHFPGLPV